MSCQIRAVSLLVLALVLLAVCSFSEASFRRRALPTSVKASRSAKKLSSRIVGGEVSDVSAAPYQISLQNAIGGYYNFAMIFATQ